MEYGLYQAMKNRKYTFFKVKAATETILWLAKDASITMQYSPRKHVSGQNGDNFQNNKTAKAL